MSSTEKPSEDPIEPESSPGPQYLLAVDPGKISGVVVVRLTESGVEVVSSDELPQYETCSFVETWLAEYASITTVICERFHITTQTGKMRDTSYSLEIIGTLRYLAKRYGARFHLQTPADAKTFSTNEKLKVAGFWHRGGGAGHANDAFRHALLYLARTRLVNLTAVAR